LDPGQGPPGYHVETMERLGWTGCVVVALALVLGGCGGSSTPPPSTPPPGGTGETISGNERLGWNQGATSASELATFRYAAYIDGNRVELTDASCGGLSGGAAPCSSRMPAMTPGAHSIELASFIVDGGSVIESGRSAPLRVTVTGATPGLPPDGAGGLPASTMLTTADGADLRLDAISVELEAPTAMAIAPDGRVFVAEQAGRIRILRGGVLEAQPAIAIADVLMTSTGDGGLLSIALDAQSARTQFVYAAYTVLGPDDTRRFRVVRYREVEGRLGERAVLLDGIPAAPRPAVVLGIGPDGLLYVAFDAAVSAGRTPLIASYSGKILRLNTDGTTPRDQPSGNPVFGADFASPRAFDWHPSTGALVVADVRRRDLEELRIVPASLAGSASPARTRMPLPAATGAAGMAFYDGTLVPAFAGNLFVAAEEGRALLRLQFDSRDPTRTVSIERLLDDTGDRVRAVAVGGEGLVYVATDRALLRLGPR
jgi:aldose sugar dehydrogenase